MQIRRVHRDEADRLRQIRLRALADAPTAFDSALADERDKPQEMWENRAAAGAAGETAITFFAEDRGDCFGLATGLIDADDPDAAEVVSMWVDPRARGRGMGKLLLDEVMDWSRERGVRRVGLWVNEANDPARLLYEKAGFAPTGERRSLNHNPSLIGIRLTRQLTD